MLWIHKPSLPSSLPFSLPQLIFDSIMDPPGISASGDPSPTRRELQGPRPSPLRVSKDSHKIRKPPPAYPQAQRPLPPHPAAAAATTMTNQDRQPVIIYAVSPKVIHTTVSDFPTLVQRLTGHSSSFVHGSGGDVSPAARLAAIERTSPKERDKERERSGDLTGMVEGVEVGQTSQIPGILSPAPATLVPISPGFFSPASDPFALSVLNDLSSPFMLSNNMFIQSPSALFSTPIVSPSPSSFDCIYNSFLDF